MSESIQVEPRWAEKNPELAVVGMFGVACAVLLFVVVLSRWMTPIHTTCPRCGTRHHI